MYTEDEFFQIIKYRTGWDITDPNPDKRFGFINGACSPFTNTTNKGNFDYFHIWKKENGVNVEASIDCESPEKTLEKIIKFLETPFIKNEKGEVYIVGEYDNQIK